MSKTLLQKTKKLAMLQKIRFHHAKKNQKVILSKELPVGQDFGNKWPIKQDVRGDVISDGFENGQLRVKFYTYLTGTELVHFNELSAANYLLIDIY